MGSRRPVAVAVVLVLGATAVLAATGTATPSETAPAVDLSRTEAGENRTLVPDDRRRSRPPDRPTGSPDPSIVMYINLTPDGDARWTVGSRFELDDEADREAFRAYLADVRNGTSPARRVRYSPDTFRAFADRVEDVTDRREPMRIENVTWRGWANNSTGVIALSFTWTNFARADRTRVVLGDVFDTGSDSWFGSVEPGQRLVINAPPGYALEDYSLNFPFSNGTVVIDGPANLSAMDVSIVYERTVPTPTTPPPTPNNTTPTPNTTTPTPGNGTTPTPTTSTPTTDPPEEGGGAALLIGGGLVVLAVVVLVAAYLLSDRRGTTEPSTAADAGTDGGVSTESPTGSDTAPPAGETEGDPAETDETADASEDDESPEAGGVEDTEEDEDEEEDTIDEELLSDEERVERLLERNGGRMKQANIVTETGWSNAKVSQLLSSMDDEDRIDKLRIGRENLITLPDEDVGEIE